MQNIPDVTLLMLADLDIPEAVHAVNKSCEQIKWGAVKFLSSKGKPEGICEQATYEEVYPIQSINDFNFYCIYTVSYTHLRAHETINHLVCRLQKHFQ